MTRMRIPASVGGCALLAAVAAAAMPARAADTTSALKGHNTHAPVDVAADRIEVQDRADRAVFSGNVVAKQGDMTMTAPRVTVAYSNKGAASSATANGTTSGIEIQRIDASGGVTVRSPTETAVGQFAIYDLNNHLITMLGSVTLTQGASHVTGPRLVIDLDSGRAVMDGGAPGVTNRGGRVTGTFTVPQHGAKTTGTATTDNPAAAAPKS